MAVIVWLAADKALVVNVAWPLPLTGPVPIVLPPSWNVTVPVGVPALGKVAVTVAVKVTDSPNTVGLLLVATVVVVSPGETFCPVLPLLVLKLASPLYVAVIVCAPVPRLAVLNVAWPLTFTAPEPSVVEVV